MMRNKGEKMEENLSKTEVERLFEALFSFDRGETEAHVPIEKWVREIERLEVKEREIVTQWLSRWREEDVYSNEKARETGRAKLGGLAPNTQMIDREQAAMEPFYGKREDRSELGKDERPIWQMFWPEQEIIQEEMAQQLERNSDFKDRFLREKENNTFWVLEREMSLGQEELNATKENDKFFLSLQPPTAEQNRETHEGNQPQVVFYNTVHISGQADWENWMDQLAEEMARALSEGGNS